MRALVEKTESYGLKFEAIENVPTHFYDKAMLGLEGRDEQIENYQKTIRAVARAGVPVLGYHFMPNSVWRTERLAPTRGGAGATRFDMAVVEQSSRSAGAQEIHADDARPPVVDARARQGRAGDHRRAMWANYEYFIKAVLPVAEEEGVRLALHPDDPPVPMLGGVARLFYQSRRTSSGPMSSPAGAQHGRSIFVWAAARR